VRRLKTRRAGPMWVRDPGGGLAHAHRLGGRQAGHCSSSPGPGPCLRRPGNGASGLPPVMNRVQSASHRGRRNDPTGACARLSCPRPNLGPARPSLGPTSGPPRKFLATIVRRGGPTSPPCEIPSHKNCRRREPTAESRFSARRSLGPTSGRTRHTQSHKRSVVARPRPKTRKRGGFGTDL